MRQVVTIPEAALHVTVLQVAAMGQVSKRQIERWMSLDAIPGLVRIGRSVRFQRAIVEQWFVDGCPSLTTRRRRSRSR